MALPAGFVDETPGSGFYPAADRTGFAALDSPDTGNGSIPFDQATQSVIATLRTLVQDYQQTNVTTTPDTIRVDFTARADGRPGRGTLYFQQTGTTVCGATLFLQEGSSIPFEPTLQGMIASLQAVR